MAINSTSDAVEGIDCIEILRELRKTWLSDLYGLYWQLFTISFILWTLDRMIAFFSGHYIIIIL